MSKRKLFVPTLRRWLSVWVPVLALLKWKGGMGPLSGDGEPSSDPLASVSSPFDRLKWFDNGYSVEGVGGDDFGEDDDTDESVVVAVLLVMVVVDAKPSRAKVFPSMFVRMVSSSVFDSSSSRSRSRSRSLSLSSGGESKGLLGGLPTTFQLSSAVSGCWLVDLLF